MNTFTNSKNIKNIDNIKMNFTINTLSGDRNYELKDIGNVFDFIKVFEEIVGIKFNRVVLFNEDNELTKSRKYMTEHMVDQMELTMIVNDKPIRIMDEDVVRYCGYTSCRVEIDEMEDTFGNIEDWNTSFMTDMSHMFSQENCEKFNKNISKWDVSSVENMDCMFFGCSYFNQDLSNWDVSKVRLMRHMFENCESFDQDLNKWDVGSHVNMKDIFLFSGLSKVPEWDTDD